MKATCTNFLIGLLSCLMTVTFAIAQQPRNIPQPNGDPLRLDNWTDIVVFVAMPTAVIIFYVIWKRRKKREEEENED